MDRRTFLCGIALGGLSAPLAADAQQVGKVYRVGFLGALADATPVRGLREGLLQLG